MQLWNTLCTSLFSCAMTNWRAINCSFRSKMESQSGVFVPCSLYKFTKNSTGLCNLACLNESQVLWNSELWYPKARYVVVSLSSKKKVKRKLEICLRTKSNIRYKSQSFRYYENKHLIEKIEEWKKNKLSHLSIHHDPWISPGPLKFRSNCVPQASKHNLQPSLISSLYDSNLTRFEQNKPRGQSYRSARTRQHAGRSLKYGGEDGSISREICRWILLFCDFDGTQNFYYK